MDGNRWLGGHGVIVYLSMPPEVCSIYIVLKKNPTSTEISKGTKEYLYFLLNSFEANLRTISRKDVEE